MSALNGIKVVRIGHTLAGAYCCKLMRGFGADVVAVDPPGTDNPDDARDATAAEHAWYAFDAGRVAQDWSQPDAAHTLLAEADVLIDTRRPADTSVPALQADALRARHPALVVCRITPFGLTGPYRDWAASDMTLYAMSGLMQTTGDADREPLNAAPRVVQLTAGLHAYIACLMGIFRRAHDQHGDYIDLSMQESATANCEVALAECLTVGKVARRISDRHTLVPWRTYKCADGEAAIMSGPMRHWPRAQSIFGLDDDTFDAFATMEARIARREAFDAIIQRWLSTQRKHDIFRAGQENGLAWSYLATMQEALAEPQLKARDFFETARRPDGQTCQLPGAPFRPSATPWHGDPTATNMDDAPTLREPPQTEQPLSGIRVLDFTHDWAGPHAARLLADYGADVVKIECPSHLDIARGAYHDRVNDHPRFWHLHRNKRSLTLDLKRDDHAAFCRKLVADSDVILENSRPGVMARLGLDYAAARRINPHIIVVSLSAFGATGPYARYPGYGGSIEAISGVQSLTAYEPDGQRYRMREMDVTNGIFGTCAMMTALMHMRRTGQGQWVDVSETETCCWLMGEFVAEASVTGEEITPTGNRDARHAPQGCYPCAEDDRWLTLTVRTDTEWQGLTQVIGASALANEATCATPDGRRARHDAIDAAITAWTKTQSPHEAMRQLQAAGVPAGMVMHAADLRDDAHLAARDWFEQVDGAPCPGFPFHLSRGAATMRRRGPDLGADNAAFEALYGPLNLGDALAAENLVTAYDSPPTRSETAA